MTVKSRIAIDEMEEWPTLEHFVGRVRAAGCTRFIVHARKAWLKGLSPNENRDIPPLRYELVHRLKGETPDLDITINGGITTLDQASEHLALWMASCWDGPRTRIRGCWPMPTAGSMGPANSEIDRHEVVRRMLPYIEARRGRGHL